jgi:hypothetical protein
MRPVNAFHLESENPDSGGVRRQTSELEMRPAAEGADHVRRFKFTRVNRATTRRSPRRRQGNAGAAL